MSPDGTNGYPYRVVELERRMNKLEDRVEAIKFEALRVELHEARKDITQLGVRFGRMTWLLVTTIASVATGIVIVALSLTGGH